MGGITNIAAPLSNDHAKNNDNVNMSVREFHCTEILPSICNTSQI